MLEILKTRYAIYLLSNTNALHLARAFDDLEKDHGVTDFDAQYFDTTYYSHLIGFRKPDPAAFRHVIEDSFLTPEYTLYIDDMPENIRAARKLGFQTHLSPPDEEIAEFLKREGFY
jgi:putative hydrolase of the HAD superfamily